MFKKSPRLGLTGGVFQAVKGMKGKFLQRKGKHRTD
ncbi:hypothetical protein SAMN04490197_1338 [Pseudomonas orientalis]|uniref:Uncharacterized protein n=1 Tax=Pseudomonas orientalis TaxID=76758 RepID=A0A8B3XUZ8_9PSED|nr:hypothetical protein SAMN04490197_1338 [Pseudomonas orientalis]